MWSAGQFTTLDVPGAIFTGAGGINPDSWDGTVVRTASSMAFCGGKGPRLTNKNELGAELAAETAHSQKRRQVE